MPDQSNDRAISPVAQRLRPLESIMPWRERAFVTVAEAAVIVARSTTWIRDQMLAERLTGVQVTRGGPVVVAVPSLRQLVDAAQPVSGKRLFTICKSNRSERTPDKAKPPTLRLVVNNDQ